MKLYYSLTIYTFFKYRGLILALARGLNMALSCVRAVRAETGVTHVTLEPNASSLLYADVERT
jgi:hypothetical protein